MPSKPKKTLKTFENQAKNRDYLIQIRVPEFTCLCPKTGQPDFATIYINYFPNELCIELKSLKLYMWSYRDQADFHEAVTNKILDDLVDATNPKFMRLSANFYVRGGIYTTVTAEHVQDDYKPRSFVQFPKNNN